MNADHPEPSVLEARGLTKRFGSVIACNDVSLVIRAGEIHALLGENGAGKSTLVKMLFGSLQPDAGEIFWRSEPVRLSNPQTARALGVSMVFQHFSLFEALTVAENIALAIDDDAPLSRIATEARELSRRYDLPIDPDAIVGDLSVGERQRVEIVRCLLQNPQVLILDEPTSVLTPMEADRLFATLERMREEGRSVLYITHRLEEVQRLCQRATIMRRGEVVDTCDPRLETASTLAARMVGEEVVRPSRAAPVLGPTVLSVRGLSAPADGPFAIPLQNVTFDVHAGEIFCVAGIAGNGQSKLFSALSGEIVVEPSMIRLDDREIGALGISPRRELGAAFAPEERNGHAAAPAFSLSRNTILSRHASDRRELLGAVGVGLLRDREAQSMVSRVSEAMDVRKGSPDPAASSLSGGNLQKFLMGRELDRQPRLFVVNQPTWGVDAAAAARIHQALLDLSREGSALVVISQDLDEIFALATTIAVITDGRLTSQEAIASMTREKIGLLMGGVARTEAA